MLNTPKEYNGKFPEKEQYSQDKEVSSTKIQHKEMGQGRGDGSAGKSTYTKAGWCREFNTRDPRGGRGEKDGEMLSGST